MQETPPSSTGFQTGPPAPTPQPPKKINKGLIIGIVAGLCALLAVVGILLYALLSRSNDSTDSNQSNQTTSENTPTQSAKTVIATTPTKTANIDFVLYTPTQTSSNTTINFALKNTCSSDCPAQIYISSPYHSAQKGVNMKDTYLVDNAASQKYSVITDSSDNALVSPSCEGYLKTNQKLDCFIAFTKVPSGSTASLVMRDYRIDDVKIP